MFVVVPSNMAYVVERLGRYRGTLNAGFHVLVPLFDRVAFRFSLQPKDTEIAEVAITLDNVPLKITSRVRWQIVDPERAAYAVAAVEEHVAAAVKSGQRQWIGARKETYARENTRELEADAASSAEAAAEQAGVRIEDVSVLRIGRTT